MRAPAFALLFCVSAVAGCSLLVESAFAAPDRVRELRSRETVNPDTRPGRTKGRHPGGPRFTPADGGLTVHDNVLHVTWLVDADYPAKHKFGLPINDSGSMTYETAQDWVEKLRESDGPLGHKHWQLPMTPPQDPDCNTRGPKPLYDKFGYGCVHSAMGSLFYDKDALNLSEYQTAVPIHGTDFKDFKNLQPYLYWTSTAGNNKSATAPGYVTFSFASGWTGNNVYQHVMYVLPILQGNPFGAPSPPDKSLQVTAGGEAVYDPATDVTWAADANLAAKKEFQVSGVNRDGSMEQPKNGRPDPTTIADFLSALNHHGKNGYLNQSKWKLPPAKFGKGLPCGGFNCTDSPLGELFYHQLGLAKGDTVLTLHKKAGPFENLQPYLYWSCQGVEGKPDCNDKSPGKKFAWSFSFGNGFEGTDLVGNELFVMAYYPDSGIEPPPNPSPRPPVKCRTPETCCTLNGGTWSGGKCI